MSIIKRNKLFFTVSFKSRVPLLQFFMNAWMGLRFRIVFAV
jgi:hypothetical protein